MRYRTYSEALKERFGEKVYKIPVQLPVSCPNRDGHCGTGGCIFCGDVGTGFENLSAQLPVTVQLEKNIAYIGAEYKAKKFIAYFNNFSNTYLPADQLKHYMLQAFREDIVGLCLSTRPDCVSEAHLQVLKDCQDLYAAQFGKPLEVTLELGLQSVNYKTLKKLNRGHGLAEFIEAVQTIKTYGFRVCTHLIGNLPWDDEDDLVEGARILSVLKVDEVKIHTLYILRNTELGRLYEAGKIQIGTPEAYVSGVVAFIRHAAPTMVFQRFAGRAPEEETLFCNWNMSWWKIKDMIDQSLEAGDFKQGDLYHYAGGSQVKRFEE